MAEDLTPIYEALRKADKAGDAEAVRKLAAYLGTLTKPAPEKIDPTEGMSGTEKFLAGAGKGLTDIARGVGQAVGLVSEDDIKASRERDAALMKTGAGTAGNIVGTAAPALATALIPGANTVTGSAATGAVMGALQPVVDDESRLSNATIGGAAGAGGVLATRAVAGAYGALKGILEPLSDAGRARIAGRVLERFADDPTKIAAARGAQSATGAMPTLAEETGDAGIARLQDALRSVDPQINNAIGQRLADNNAARVAALQSLGGDASKRAAAEAARDAATRDLYQQATKAAYTVDDNLKELLTRPAVKQAMERAKNLASNQGRPTTFNVSPNNPWSGVGLAGGDSKQITGQALQDLKMAMDEMLTDPASGFTGKAGNTIRDLRGKLVSWMEDANPAFKAARTTYAEKSKPINGMDVGEYLATKATSNTSDLAGNPRMQANSLMRLLRDEADLIKKATGRGELKSLDQVLDPQQVSMLRTVANEADRTAAVATAGAGPGSATAQRMAAQNIIRQIAGPAGLPESWVESALANMVVGKPLNVLYSGLGGEAKIQQALAKAVLSPADARAVLEAAQKQGIKLPDNLATRLTRTAARVSVPATSLVAGER